MAKKFILNEEANILETVKNYPAVANVFAKYGIPCLGCAAARFEKLSDISGEFGISAKELVEEIKKEQEKIKK